MASERITKTQNYNYYKQVVGTAFLLEEYTYILMAIHLFLLEEYTYMALLHRNFY